MDGWLVEHCKGICLPIFLSVEAYLRHKNTSFRDFTLYCQKEFSKSKAPMRPMDYLTISVLALSYFTVRLWKLPEDCKRQRGMVMAALKFLISFLSTIEVPK
jgi:hypothetical protein